MEHLATIFELPGNRRRLDQLVEQVRTLIGVVPFVGAGLSINYNFAGWTSFLRKVATDAGLATQVDNLLADACYEEAAQVLEATLGCREWHSQIRYEYGD